MVHLNTPRLCISQPRLRLCTAHAEEEGGAKVAVRGTEAIARPGLRPVIRDISRVVIKPNPQKPSCQHAKYQLPSWIKLGKASLSRVRRKLSSKCRQSHWAVVDSTTGCPRAKFGASRVASCLKARHNSRTTKTVGICLPGPSKVVPFGFTKHHNQQMMARPQKRYHGRICLIVDQSERQRPPTKSPKAK